MPNPQSECSIFITGTDPELFGWFLDDVLAESQDRVSFTCKAGETVFKGVCGESLPKAGAGQKGNGPEGVFCLIRYVDALEMQKLFLSLKGLAEQVRCPIYFLIYRKPNEQDYKMSCLFCGQKLWVRDADLDKRGRCPSCKKGFTLPKQEDQVIHLLGLKQDAPVYRVTHEDSSSAAAVLRVFLKRREERDALLSTQQVFRDKAETMAVRVD